ncbi:hypothetical protein NLG97_g10623 [Lecanicillium saksenae]|uniref:Uncharacterized protein n=1 Tax=Lecanicillium saksenae TaxID=468837 RepID=A0ACC1QFV7_9HYPO|nr:hypothetical protein NLG97_g10623 [Lecanicillium saksenae]
MEMSQKIAAFEELCARSAIVIPRWFPDSTSVFWYRREVSEGEFQFFLVDCEKGSRKLAFDHEVLASKLSQVGPQIHGTSLPFTWIDVDIDGGAIRFKHVDKKWRFDRDGTLLEWNGDLYEGHFDRGCDEVASPWSREPAILTLVNQTSKRIDINWISNDGDVHFALPMQPGRSRVVNSWLHHYWRLEVHESEPRSSVSFQLKNRRSSAVVQDSPLGLSLQWDLDPIVECDDDISERDTAARREAFVRNGNVWVRETDGPTAQISFQGFSDNEFKDVFTSPDGKLAIAMQCTPPSKRSLHLVDVTPDDQFLPKLTTHEFLRPGDNVEIKRPYLFNLIDKTEIPVENILFRNPYAITNVGWSSNSEKYYFVFNERGHQHMRMLSISRVGTVQVLAEEKSEKFVDYHQKAYFKLMPATNEFLWASERDNWNHIYLFDLQTGALKSQVTKGEWNVHSIDHVDVKRRKLWVRVLGINPDEDPYYAHLACVNFDGSALQVITAGDGTHSWQWGPQRRFLIDTWSRVDDLPQSVGPRRDQELSRP